MDTEVNKEIIELKDELKEVKNTLLILTKAIEKLTLTCGRMDGHINFVEKTYESLKTPLDFVKNKVETLICKKNSEDLPRLNYS